MKEKFVKIQSKENRRAKMAAVVKPVETFLLGLGVLVSHSSVAQRVIIYIYIKLHPVSLHLFSEMRPFH